MDYRNLSLGLDWDKFSKDWTSLGSLFNPTTTPNMPTKPMPGYNPTDPVKLPPKPLGTFSSGGPDPLPMQTAGPYPMGYNGAVNQVGPVRNMGSPIGPGSDYDNWRKQFSPVTSPVQNTATRHTTGSPDTTSNAGGFYGSKGYFDFRGEPQRFKG